MLSPAQLRVVGAGSARWVVTGAPRSGKSTALVERVRGLWSAGTAGDRMLLLTPDRRSARRLNRLLGEPPGDAVGRVAAMSYHSFAQDLIRRWWPLVMEQLGIQASTPEFLPFNLAQFACLNEYRADPGNLRRLTIREQRLIVQVLSNMNLSAGNGLTLAEGWERVAFGLGVPAGDPVIQDGLRLTQRFRECCLRAGVMPVDLQVEAAGRLLELPVVRGDMLARYDLLALDDLDEFIPLMAERLTSLASECRQAIVTCCDDGGLRWLLGASVERSRQICEALVTSGAFEHAHFAESHSRSPALLSGSASWLAGAVEGPVSGPLVAPTGFLMHEAERIDRMAVQVVDVVESLIASGTSPGRIALLIPYIDTLVATELTHQCAARGFPFQVDRRWVSVLDDPLSRACLTALRCASAGRGMTRKPALVEVADLVAILTEANPIRAHDWARKVYNSSTGGLVNGWGNGELPGDVQWLSRWAAGMALEEESPPLHIQLEWLAKYVIAPHESTRRADLVRACYALAREARRFVEAGPRLGLDYPIEKRFFEYVDNDIVGVDTGVDPAESVVILTTPSVFLTSGRTADFQCWLNVVSPAWWEPPLQLLSNPHAMARQDGVVALTSADDDRVRHEILGRTIRNLAARCDGEIHAFASFTGSDGSLLEGPLYDCLVEMRQAVA